MIGGHLSVRRPPAPRSPPATARGSPTSGTHLSAEALYFQAQTDTLLNRLATSEPKTNSRNVVYITVHVTSNNAELST
jgi:hypothetical protein